MKNSTGDYIIRFLNQEVDLNLHGADLNSHLLSVNASYFGLGSQVFSQNKMNIGRREEKNRKGK